MEFASDNTSGAAPGIMDALVRANAGYAPSYGTDPAMARVTALVRETFEAPEAAVYLVATGTTANALSAALLCPAMGAIYCHGEAHVEADECGAPEFFINGGRTAPVAGAHGKMTPATLAARMAQTPQGGVHHIQHGMLALTNLTEAGTAYRPGRGGKPHGPCTRGGHWHPYGRLALCQCARGPWLHPGRSHLAGGIDALSFGGTKNGCLGVEAVVLFDPRKPGSSSCAASARGTSFPSTGSCRRRWKPI